MGVRLRLGSLLGWHLGTAGGLRLKGNVRGHRYLRAPAEPPGHLEGSRQHPRLRLPVSGGTREPDPAGGRGGSRELPPRKNPPQGERLSRLPVVLLLKE